MFVARKCLSRPLWDVSVPLVSGGKVDCPRCSAVGAGRAHLRRFCPWHVLAAVFDALAAIRGGHATFRDVEEDLIYLVPYLWILSTVFLFGI